MSFDDYHNLAYWADEDAALEAAERATENRIPTKRVTMPTMNFAERRKEAERSGQTTAASGFLKLQEGDNRMRLMSECIGHAEVFNGKRSFKWLCYVIDRRDGKVKAFFMPHRVYKQLEALQSNPDYEFTDVPLPFDFTINALKAGTIDVVYTVVPARKNTNITSAEMDDYEAQKPLAELQAVLQEKAKEREEKERATPQKSSKPSPQPHPSDGGEYEPVPDDSDVPF